MDSKDLLVLNIIRKWLCIPLDCDFLAPLYFLFTEIVKDVGQGSTILSDVFLSTIGQQFMLGGNACREEMATDGLGHPCLQ